MQDRTTGRHDASIYEDIDWQWAWMGRTALGRFMSKIDHRSDDGCWIWTGAFSNTGYGSFNVQQRKYLAHRAMFSLWYGPTALELDHICRTPACVNPEHLEPVSHWENVARGESPSANHLRSATCKYGHPWTPENTGRASGGTRRCLTCHRMREAAKARALREKRPVVLTVRETARRLGIHENTVRSWTAAGRLTNIAPPILQASRYDPEQVEAVRLEVARETLLRHRPDTIRCPVCGKPAETLPVSDEETAYICDTETCPVSSLSIRWRTMQEEHVDALVRKQATR